MWRKIARSPAEKKAQNPVTSLAVMVFEVPTNSCTCLSKRPATSGLTLNVRIIKIIIPLSSLEASYENSTRSWRGKEIISLGSPCSPPVVLFTFFL